MKAHTLALIVSLGLISGSARAADDSFVGKWKFNPDKSQLTGLDYKIEDAGGGKYRFMFGDDVETLTLDGKGHLTKFGDTWSIKATGPSSWDSITKRDGRVTNEEKWTVSEDGQTFTSMAENMRPDGSTGRSEATFKRTGGTAGLVGTWESTSIKVMSPTTMELAQWEKDGYSMMNPTFKEHLNFKFDGKEHRPMGPRVAKGTTATATKVDDHTMELTYKLKGKTTETDRWELSADGKSLTDTVTYAGVNKPEVDAYDRE
ncbi:MAG: hypothetical protein ACREIF_08970 [Chthoniobacterales bacterium]